MRSGSCISELPAFLPHMIVTIEPAGSAPCTESISDVDIVKVAVITGTAVTVITVLR